MTLSRLSSGLNKDKYAEFLVDTSPIKWVAPLIFIVVPFVGELKSINVVRIGDTIP